MNPEKKGFREIEHTADWELEVWAPDLAGLFEQAAHGMYSLMSIRLEAGPRKRREIALDAFDQESLLIGFLEELRYIIEMENLAFDSIKIDLNDLKLAAHLVGGPIASLSKEIKAVTYHRLAIRPTGQGLRVNIVFDV